MLTRWFIYFSEMFNPFSRIFFALISCTAVIFAAQTANGESTLIMDYSILLGTLSYFFIMLYYRLCDEFKDLDTDIMFFPERPVPSGRVLLSDLKVLIYLITLIMFALNIIWHTALFAFLALYLFSFCMGKWFFMESLISKNRILAFITHSPVSYFGGFYLVSLYASPNNLSLFSANNWLIVTWIALPGFIWEIARKTRAPEEEEENYQTYSIILGYRVSSIITLLFVIGEVTCFWFLGGVLHLSSWVFVLMVIATLSLSLLLGLFMAVPQRYSRFMRPAAEFYGALCLLIVIVDLLVTKGIAWEIP